MSRYSNYRDIIEVEGEAKITLSQEEFDDLIESSRSFGDIIELYEDDISVSDVVSLAESMESELADAGYRLVQGSSDDIGRVLEEYASNYAPDTCAETLSDFFKGHPSLLNVTIQLSHGYDVAIKVCAENLLSFGDSEGKDLLGAVISPIVKAHPELLYGDAIEAVSNSLKGQLADDSAIAYLKGKYSAKELMEKLGLVAVIKYKE